MKSKIWHPNTNLMIICLLSILSYSSAFAQNDSLTKVKNKRFFVGLGSGVGFGYSYPHEKAETPYYSFYPEASIEIKLSKRINLAFYSAFYKLLFYKNFLPHYSAPNIKRWVYTFDNIDYSIGPNIAISRKQRFYLHTGIGMNYFQDGYTKTEPITGEYRKTQYKFFPNRNIVFSLQLRYLIYQIKHLDINIAVKGRFIPNVIYDHNRYDNNYFELKRCLLYSAFLLQLNFH